MTNKRKKAMKKITKPSEGPLDNAIITEKDRLMYMIQLNARCISPSDFSLDDILREQIQRLKERIAALEGEEKA